MDRRASRLRRLVESLILASFGDRPKVEKTIGFLRGQARATDVASHIENILAAGTDEVPYFAVGIRNGTVRAFYPSDRDPLEYRRQVTARAASVS
jgi:hypothetical protein